MSNSLKLKHRPEGDVPGQALALRHVGEAFSILLDIMRDKAAGPATRLRAVTAVIERAWGRIGSAAKGAAKIAAEKAPTVGSFVDAPKLTREEWIHHFGRLGGAAAPSKP
jgi:hypothetical protein